MKKKLDGYIATLKNNRTKLVELKKAIGRYKMICNQFGKKIVDEAIFEVKKESNNETMGDLEVFLAYEQKIKKIVWNKYSNYVVSPIKEIESNDIANIAKRYNTTNEVAQTIIDFKIMDPFKAAALADIILKYNLKDNPKAVELSRIIFDNKLFIYPNTVMLAEIILKFNLKDNPKAIIIASFIMENNLKDDSNAIEIYKFILDNNLTNNANAVMLAKIVCKLNISLDLAMEVIQYNQNNYKFRQYDEKYLFHKLRQLYQIKMKTEENFNMQQEIERIMINVGMDYDKAKYFLVCCMGNNWGRNSSYYWNNDSFVQDFPHNNYEFTDEEMSVIRGYIRHPIYNQFARGFKKDGDKTVYSDESFTPAMTNEKVMDNYFINYSPLYQALNKYAFSKDIIVLRGTTIDSLKKYKINTNDSEQEIKNKLAGHYQDGGFMSTSYVVEKKGSFLDNEVNFIIDLKAGTPCGYLSGFSEFDVEREILIPPNVIFNVNDVKKMDGKIFVYLTSIPTKSISYVENNENDDTKSEGRHL